MIIADFNSGTQRPEFGGRTASEANAVVALAWPWVGDPGSMDGHDACWLVGPLQATKEGPLQAWQVMFTGWW